MQYDFWNTQGELQYSHSAVKLRLVNIPLKLSQAGFDDQEEMHHDQVRNDIDELVQELPFLPSRIIQYLKEVTARGRSSRKAIAPMMI